MIKKINTITLLFITCIFLYASFEDYTKQLNIFDDSLQTYLDSILINDYPDSIFQYSIKAIHSKNWIKRNIGIRILKKYPLNDSLNQVLLNTIPPEYLFKITDNIQLDDIFLKRILNNNKLKTSIVNVFKNNPDKYKYIKEFVTDTCLSVSIAALNTLLEMCKNGYFINEHLLNTYYNFHNNYFTLSLIDSILFNQKESIKDTNLLLNNLIDIKKNRIRSIMGIKEEINE